MTAQMTAALHLVLDDKISAGLKAMGKQLDGLRDAGKGLTLGALDTGLNAIRNGVRSANDLKRGIAGIGDQARSAGSAIKRMAEDLRFAAQYHGTLAAQGVGRFLSRNSRPTLAGAREQIGVLGGVAAGYSVMQPIRTYAEQENVLRHIAITEKKSGPDVEREVGRLNRNFNEDALLTGQSSKSIGHAYSDLVQTGIPASQLDKVITAHSKAATAYNISPEALGPAVGALISSFKVPEEELGSALAAMALAAKEGRFKVENFSQQLPGVAANFASAGITGRQGAVISFAALETVMKNSSDPSQAATSLNEVMSNIFSPFAERFFKKKGVDLGQMLRNAEKQGVNPLDAVLGKLQQLTQGKTPVEAKQILGALVHDETARKALIALLQHREEFGKLRAQLGAAGPQTLDNDFASAVRAPLVQVRIFEELVDQLGRRIGQGFMPVLYLINAGLLHVLHAMEWLDQVMPGLGDGVLATAAGFILLGGALGIIGTVAPAIVAGFQLMLGGMRLLLAPVLQMWRGLLVLVEVFAALIGVSTGVAAAILIVAGILVAAAVDIFENWNIFSGFFQEMWNGIKQVFRGIGDFIMGWIHGDWQEAMRGLEEIWSGVGMFFEGLWHIVEGLFDDFVRWVDTWTGGAASAAVQKIKDAWGALKGWFEQLWKDIQAPFDRFVENVQSKLPSFFYHPPTDPVAARAEALRQNGTESLGLPGLENVQMPPVAAPAANAHMIISHDKDLTAKVQSTGPGVTVTTRPLNTGDVYRHD